MDTDPMAQLEKLFDLYIKMAAARRAGKDRKAEANA